MMKNVYTHFFKLIMEFLNISEIGRPEMRFQIIINVKEYTQTL